MFEQPEHRTRSLTPAPAHLPRPPACPPRPPRLSRNHNWGEGRFPHSAAEDGSDGPESAHCEAEGGGGLPRGTR